MARRFTRASSERVVASSSTVPTGTGISLAAVVRLISPVPTAAQTIFNNGPLYLALSANAASVVASVANSNSITGATGTIPADEWVLIAATKPTGTAAVRFHVYRYSTASWVRVNGGSDGNNASSSAPFTSLGSYDGSFEFCNMDIAAIGYFPAGLSDSQVDALPHSLAAWSTFGPRALWVFDQASTSTAVLNRAGLGANQSSITGTSVSPVSAPIGYGHPVLGPTRSSGYEHLFRNQTPTVTNASDGTPGITVATTFRSAVDGQVSAVRFFATTTVSGVYTAALWSVDSSDPGTGTLLASATMGSAPTPGTWNTVPISPVSVTAGTAYRASVFSGDGRYVATTSFFGSDLVNGNLTADADGDTVAGKTISQGTFRINASAGYPNSPGSGTAYFVDVDFLAGAGGSVTHNADATLAGTGTLTGAATRDTSTTATLAGTGALTGTATKATSGTATLAGTGALTATGVRAQESTATLAGTGTLASAGIRAQDATAILAGTGGLSATGLRSTDGTATLAATGSLTGTAIRAQATTALLAGLGGLTATGTTGGEQTATLPGAGTLSAAGERTGITTGVLSATGALTATSTTTRSGTAVLSATGSLSAAGDVTPPGVETATLSGTGALSATAVRTGEGAGALAGVGSLIGAAECQQNAAVTLTGAGGFFAAAAVERVTLATFAGVATLAAVADVQNEQSAALAGVGSLSGAASAARAGTATLAAVGSLTGQSGTAQSAAAVLAGTGTLTAVTITRRRPGRFTTGSRRSMLTPGGHR